MVAKGRKERKNYLSTFPCCQIFFVWQKLEPFLFWKVMLHLTSQVILTLKKLKVAAQPVLPAVSSVACQCVRRHCHCRSQLEDFCSSCCDRMAYHSSQWNIVFKFKKIKIKILTVAALRPAEVSFEVCLEPVAMRELFYVHLLEKPGLVNSLGQDHWEFDWSVISISILRRKNIGLVWHCVQNIQYCLFTKEHLFQTLF